MLGSISIHPDVQNAVAERRPVVALESAVLTAGVPDTPLGRVPKCDAPDWDAEGPVNLEVARLLERTVRDSGAVPALVAVNGGTLHVGLDAPTLRRVLAEGFGRKVSAAGLAVTLSRGETAGTTVSATVLACARASIRVMATGGIGGVHRGWAARPDLSTDLHQLATTPVCVVSSGVKSVLDVPATLELLEAAGVAVIAFGTDRFPTFYCREGAEHAPHRVDGPDAVVEVCHANWAVLHRRSAVLVANPVPAELALDPAEVDRVVAEAERDEVTGPGRTPHLLDAVVAGTSGRALDANIALLASNARLACEVAALLLNRGVEPADDAGVEFDP